MDCLPSYSPPTASKHEQTLVVPSQLAKVLGCDITEAKGIWQDVKQSKTEKEVQQYLESANVFKSDLNPSSILQIFQVVEFHKRSFTCMLNSPID